MKNGDTQIRIAYISGPYTAESTKEIDENIYAAWITALAIAEKGWFPFTPHKNTDKFDRFCSMPYEFYIDGDLEIIRRLKPDAIVLFGDYTRSEGCKAELKLANELGIKVYTSVNDLPDISPIDSIEFEDRKLCNSNAD